jgi:predicted AlkP superfamily phosphohydrolase/phosphomutase
MYMDQILGEYRTLLGPNTDVIVLSDHGFGPDPKPKYPFRTGEHRLHGVLVASGPHFQQGVKLEQASVLDITPTLLYLFGLPTAKDMDGKVLTEAINPAFITAHPLGAIQSYEKGRRNAAIIRSSADARIREQIGALGYTQ